ncbi:MAG: DUF2303 family protein [Pseudonocardiaceae bacterium]
MTTKHTDTTEAEIVPPGTEAGVIAALARAAHADGQLFSVEPHDASTAVCGWVLDSDQRVQLDALERYGEVPSRPRGTAKVTEPGAFADYVLRLAGAESATVWVQRRSWTAPPDLVAVLNDHQPAADGVPGVPGWRDHRINLELAATPDWAHWVGRDGKLTGQADFAEHIEDGIAAVVEPAAADLLEIAQTFHAARAVEFSSATRIDSGDVQLRWHETTQASAGRSKDLTVPERFRLALEPWPGAGGYEVTARLRWRLESGQLRIGYRLHRVDDVMRTAVADLVADLTDRMSPSRIPVLGGIAPAAVAPLSTDI